MKARVNRVREQVTLGRLLKRLAILSKLTIGARIVKSRYVIAVCPKVSARLVKPSKLDPLASLIYL